MVNRKEKYKTAWLYLLTTILFAFPAFPAAGETAPPSPFNDYLIDEFGPVQGLPVDSVLSMTQTPDGYLWLGTRKGLFRYDGTEFEHITFDSCNNCPVLLLFVDKKGKLWIGTPQAAAVYQNRKFQIARVTNPQRRAPCISEDTAGNIWIGTESSHLYRFPGGDAENPEIITQPFSGTSDVLEDRQGNLWIGTRQNGLYLYKNGNFLEYTIESIEKPFSITYLFEDGDGYLWLGTPRGLIRIQYPLELQKKQVRHFTTAHGLTSDNIVQVFEDSDRKLWVATTSGLNRLKRTASGDVKIESLYNGILIQSIFEDREKNLWVGTLVKRLKRFRKRSFFSFQDHRLFYPYVPCLYKARNNDIWIGSRNGRLLRYRDDAYKEILPKGTIEKGIMSMLEDNQGNLWVATEKEGLFRLQDNRLVGPIKPGYSKRHGSGLLSLSYDRKGRLWVATSMGCFYIRGTESRLYKTEDGLAGNRVEGIYEDKQGNIRVCTDGGLNFFKNGEIKKQNNITYLEGHHVISIYEDHDTPGTYWVATRGSGLFRYSDGEFTGFDKSNGLGSDFVYHTMEDHLGNLWISSRDGVIRVDKQELNRAADENIPIAGSMIFGSSDGMENAECKRYGKNAILKTNDGELWFSTAYGVAKVNPARIAVSKAPPPVIIKKIRLNGKPVDLETDGQTLKGIESLGFSFTALTFINPRRVKYQVKLDGFDNRWQDIPTSNHMEIYYYDLPYGSYRFRVKACNSSNVWNHQGVSFAFTLKPYYYQTILFKVLVFILVVGLVFFAYRGIKRYRYMKKLASRYHYSTLEAEEAEDHLRKLLHLLQKEKVYRDEGLTLASLAEKLSISSRHLSQVINESLGKNFRDLINEYRVKEAKQRLRRLKGEESVLAICFEVGFNSKAAFYRAFKKVTGLSPTEYRKKTQHAKKTS